MRRGAAGRRGAAAPLPRTWLARLGLPLAVAVALGVVGAPTSPSTPPPTAPGRSLQPPPAAGAGSVDALRGADLVLITVDTLRADALGFAGNRLVSTPTLDRLAAAGRVFPDAHAHNVVTLPSHTNILSGLYPFQHGVRENSGVKLPPAVPTLGTYLRRARYATAAFVGAFPLDSRFGLGGGFDRYDDAFPRGSDPEDYRFAERRGDEVVKPAQSVRIGTPSSLGAAPDDRATVGG